MTTIKLVIVGDAAVGKTSMWQSFNGEELKYVPTVFDNYEATIPIDDQIYTLNIFDTAGVEGYERLRPLSYPQTDVILIVFSVVCPKSFDNVTKKWIPEMMHYCPNTPIIIVGNKTDLRGDRDILKKLRNEKKTAIFSEMGEQLTLKFNATKYLECSCLDGTVKNVFYQAVRTVLTEEKPKNQLFH